MRMTSIFAIAVVLFAVLFLSPLGAAQEQAIIGVPLPLTGQFKEFGIMMKNSFEMALEFINQNKKMDDHPLQLVFADDKGREDTAAEVFSKLSASGVVMLAGGYASNPTYRLAKIADNKNLPFLICTASADRITRQGWKNVYRLNPPISEYTQGLEDFWVKNLKPRSMAILYENSMFGTDGSLRMLEFCRNQAIDVVFTFGYDRSRQSPVYFRSILAPLKAAPPDVIYMVSYLEDAVMLVKTIRELRISSPLCGGAGGFTMEEFVRRAGDAANGLLTAALWSEHVPYPGAEKYFSDYLKRYGISPDYHGAEAYSALIVAADALKRAKTFSPKDIRASLDNTFIKTPFAPVKFYNYNNFERQNSISTLVLQVINGKYETIWPTFAASMPFTPPEN